MADTTHESQIRGLSIWRDVTHTFSMKRFYTGAIFFGLLGSTATHAQGISENADPPIALRGSESLGEAVSQKTVPVDNGNTRVPETNTPPLKMSESLVGLPVAEVMPPSAPLPLPLPSTPSTALPPAVEREKRTTEKQPLARQTVLTDAETDNSAKFGIAPISWSGDVAENLRWRRYTTTDGSPAISTLDNMQTINLRASSYLWQPWIATVDGGIGLLHSSQSSGGASSSSSTSNGVTGNVGLSLFPRSRFPFRASYDVSDSRTSTSLASASGDYSSKRLSLQQAYNTVSGETNLMASFDQSTLNSASFGDDVVSSVKGNYSARFGTTQTAGLSVFHTESSQQAGNSGLHLNGFTAQHSYRSDSRLTVDTSANFTNTAWNTVSQGVANSNTSRYLQASTFANWQPDEDRPLYINGGFRLYTADSTYSGTDSKTQSLGGNLMANYNPTRNIALSISGTATRVTSGDQSSLTTTQSGNAAYNADVIKFGKDISYNWNVSGNLTNQTSSDGMNDQRVAAAGSHSLLYPYSISPGSVMNFSANQSLSTSYDRIYGTSEILTHNGVVSWSASQAESLSGSANASVGDTHTFGYNEADYQFANLNLNGRKQFSLNSSLGANAGLNWNREGVTGRVTTGINGSISYLHSRAFNVRGLRYSLTASANTTSYDERVLGNVNAQRSQSGYSLDQHLNYRIGKMDTSLSAIVSRFDGKENASIFVRIMRFFGNM